MSATPITFQNPVFDPNTKRNVVDHLAWMQTDQIKAELETQTNNFGILLLNIDYDNNAGNIIRSANAFGAKEIILYGRKKFDHRASVGVEFYMNFRQIKWVEEVELTLKEYDVVVALENQVDSIPLTTFEWDKSKSYLICVGQEGNGLPQEILEKCDFTLEIPQQGSVRSLNVSVASGICMYDYCHKTQNV